MELDMVADMEVDKVTDMEVDLVTNNNIDINMDIRHQHKHGNPIW